jgi:hypothetical protein
VSLASGPAPMPSTPVQQVSAGSKPLMTREVFDKALLGVTGVPPPKQAKKRAPKKLKMGDSNYCPTPQEARGNVLIAGVEWPLPHLNISTGLIEVTGIPPTAVGYARVTPSAGWGGPENDPRVGQPLKAQYFGMISERLYPVYTSDFCHWCTLFGVQHDQDRFGGLCIVCKRGRGEP